ncbi:coiled-coil domain-containing protein 82 isoform 2-T2 [Anomaloglossus baeobatrachus]|uniref:coiled-coil domain-containing protein 82 isoform X2 n=1 Tax=Anomaloglossus baeobatrachus TaxID=238106 RepID=UPI003F509DD6
MENACKRYNTRQKRKSVESSPKSRVDWKRTKRDSICQIPESDESFTSEEEELEESDEESEDSSPTDLSEGPDNEATRPEEDGDEGRIRKPRLKSKSATIGSDSSSDSDGPGEKANLKRSCVINEDDSDEEVAVDKETKTHLKKQKRQEALRQLAEKQKSRKRTTSHETSEESPDDLFAPLTPESLGDHDDEDSDDMSNFIVEDEEENDGEDADNPPSSYKDLFRKHHISLSADHDLSFHLQKAIKAFLINITDEKFLSTLYKGIRRKRYAQDMLKSLNHLDERIIAPRLEKLTASCRWSKRYKERINSYPELHVKNIVAEEMTCAACDLYRYCGFRVTLSGQAYDNRTLECDDFLPNDKQKLVIGTVCANRTEAYHQLRHYKYFLYQRCIPYIEETKEESANKIVELALSKMEAKNFLGTEVSFLESYLNEADYFQEENKDWLLS